VSGKVSFPKTIVLVGLANTFDRLMDLVSFGQAIPTGSKLSNFVMQDVNGDLIDGGECVNVAGNLYAKYTVDCDKRS
jgi:hypothetical protein